MTNKKKNAPSVLAHGTGRSPLLGSSSSSQEDDTTLDFAIQAELDGKWTKNRQLADKLVAVYRAIDEPRRAERVDNCGTWLEFAVHEGEYTLHSANFCKDRLCPMCQWRRSLKSAYQLSRVLDSAADNGCRFIFYTLTIRNCSAEDLPKTIDTLLKGWEALRHNKRFKKAVLGSFRTLEITFNRKNGTFHPHLHAVLAVLPSYWKGRDYITQKDLRKIWADCVGIDYDPVCYVQVVKDTFGNGEKDYRKTIYELTMPQSKVSASDRTSVSVPSKLSRYISKNGMVVQGDFAEQCLKAETFLSALANRRLIAYSGVLAQVHKALNLDDSENGDLIHTAENLRSDVYQMLVTYRWQFGSYMREGVN